MAFAWTTTNLRDRGRNLIRLNVSSSIQAKIKCHFSKLILFKALSTTGKILIVQKSSVIPLRPKLKVNVSGRYQVRKCCNNGEKGKNVYKIWTQSPTNPWNLTERRLQGDCKIFSVFYGFIIRSKTNFYTDFFFYVTQSLKVRAKTGSWGLGPVCVPCRRISCSIRSHRTCPPGRSWPCGPLPPTCGWWRPAVRSGWTRPCCGSACGSAAEDTLI